MFRRFPVVMLAVVFALSITQDVCALMTYTVGPDSVRGRKTHAQPGWPTGLVNIPRLETRVYSTWCNGDEWFHFNGEDKDIAEIIKRYSKIQLRDHIVRLKSSNPSVKAKETTYFYNATLYVKGGISLAYHRTQAGSKPSTFEPELTIYVRDAKDRKMLEQFSWPENLVVLNEVPKWKAEFGKRPPVREYWHAAVNFDDGSPAARMEQSMMTHVTLWEKQESQQPHSFGLGYVSHKGEFEAALSDAEIRKLKNGDMWLTMTVGNHMAKRNPGHTKLDFANLNLDPDKVKTATVAITKPYYGRLLYEDGSPATGIGVTFSYIGRVEADRKGYLKVTLTTEQFEDLRKQKTRRNIYIPDADKPNRATALYAFPADKLSQDIKQAGEVKIPAPEK